MDPQTYQPPIHRRCAVAGCHAPAQSHGVCAVCATLRPGWIERNYIEFDRTQAPASYYKLNDAEARFELQFYRRRYEAQHHRLSRGQRIAYVNRPQYPARQQ